MVMVIFFCDCTFPPLVEIRGFYTSGLLAERQLPVVFGADGAGRVC